VLSVQTPAAARAAAGLDGLAGLPVPPTVQASLHLNLLHRPGTLVEIRSKLERGMEQRFFTEPRHAMLHATQAALHRDVYVGVLPRVREAGGKDALLPHANVVWAEADNELAATRALDFTPRAHLVVRSSTGHAHFYWLLTKDIPLEYIERANKRLAWHLGCDPKATDAARILRVAGTKNFKRGAPEPVAMLRFETHPNVSARELVGHLSDPTPPKPMARAAEKRAYAALPPDAGTEALRRVPAREYIPALTGREVYHNLAQCPFHKGGQENTPSLSVGGPNEELWLCFGCDEGGDIFTMAARMWGLDERRDFPGLKARLKEVLRA
jgi:hypothetical protein